MTIMFGIVVALTAGLGLMCVWAPRKLRYKGAAMLLSAAFLPVAYASLADLLSRPKPPALEWRADLGEAEVVAFQLREGKAIYLWLRLAGVDEPRYYVLPWSQKLAEELHRAAREGRESGGDVVIRGLNQAEGEWEAHARPQPPLPPKGS